MIRSSMPWARGYRGVICLLLLLLVPILIVACTEQKHNGPSYPASVTGISTNGLLTLILTINPNNINKGDTAGITVTTQTPNGVAVPGKKVNVSTTGGTLAAVFGVTDAGGKFVTSLHVPQDYNGPSPIVVTAASDSASASVNVFLNDLGTLRIDPSSLTLAPGDRQTLTCVGGVPPYRWEVSGGTLNRQNEPTVIFTAGSAVGEFFVRCNDSAGNSASAKITISGTVAGSLAIQPKELGDLIPGQQQIFQATGGVGPYKWAATGGSPASGTGSSFKYTAGTIPGQFTVVLTDSLGQAVSVQVKITTAALTFGPNIEVTRVAIGASGDPDNPSAGTCDVLANSIEGDLTAAGGTPPYSIFAAAGTITPLTSLSSSPARVRYKGPAGATSLAGGTSVNVDTVTLIDSFGTRKEATVKVTCTTPNQQAQQKRR